MMVELTLANEAFEERMTKLSITHSENRQPAHTNEHVPLPLYDGKHDFSDLRATYLLGRLGWMALSVTAALTDPTFEEMVEALASNFGPPECGKLHDPAFCQDTEEDGVPHRIWASP